MLTGKLVRVRVVKTRVIPQYIDPTNPTWRDVAESLLVLFRGLAGRTRGELEEDVTEAVGDNPTQLVHQGLAKLLEDRCEFEVSAGVPPDEAREAVFLAASGARKAGRFDRAALLAEAAEKLLTAPEVIDRALFADLKDEQRVVSFADLTADHLLHRYNVSLAQSVLLRSTGLKVEVTGETPSRYRQLFRAVKFHRLICDIAPLPGDGHVLRLSGPMSLFSATSKYGLQLALFLPAVLQCKRFELTATVAWGAKRQEKTFTLSSGDGLRSPAVDYGDYTPPELVMFADTFREKITDWTLSQAPEVVRLQTGVWVPDFVMVHEASGAVVPVEVLGFWRKTDAEALVRRLTAEHPGPFVLALSEANRVDDAEGAPAGNVYYYKRTPLPSEVVKFAERQLGLTPGGAGA